MEFKPLDIKPQGSWIKRNYRSPHVRKSALFIIIGALVGIAWFFFTQGRHQNEFELWDLAKSMLLGGFFGFFITNSPCARGKC